jgi:DNA-binding IclR family transcriptional regulator
MKDAVALASLTGELGPAQEPTSADPAVPALMRGFAILDLIARSPGLEFTAIHSRLNLPKSSTHNLLATLCRIGALHLQSDRGYVLGLRLTELGNFAAGQRFLETESLPLLRDLAHAEQLTCHLGVIEGHEAVYLSKIECDYPIKISSWVGKRFPLHCSALGKVLMAWLAEKDLERMLAEISWERHTAQTIADPRSMKTHLDLVRARGWASDDEEHVPDIRCVAAPVFDRSGGVVAAISAVGTVLQMPPARFAMLAPKVIAIAREISHRSFGA